MSKLFKKDNTIIEDLNVSRELLTIELDNVLLQNNNLNVLSTEAIVSEDEGKTSFFDRAKQSLIDAKDKLVGVTNLFMGYDTRKLEEYLEMLNQGMLVPRKQISNKNQDKLKNKLAAFFVMGNSIRDSKDLIDYMNEPVENFLSGKYQDLMSKQFKSLFNPNTRSSKYKYKPTSINVDLTKFKMDLKLNDNQKDDIIISFLVKRFYHKLYLYTLIVTDDLSSEKGFEWFDHKFLNNVDIIDIQDKYLEDIVVWDKEDVKALLNWGIKKNRDIKSAVDKSKIIFMGYNIKAYFQNILYGLAGPLATGVYLLFGRFTDNLTSHTANVMKEIIWYDKLILDIIDAMYEKTK